MTDYIHPAVREMSYAERQCFVEHIAVLYQKVQEQTKTIADQQERIDELTGELAGWQHRMMGVMIEDQGMVGTEPL